MGDDAALISVMPYADAARPMNNEHDRASRAELARRVARLGHGQVIEGGAGVVQARAGLFLVPYDVLEAEEAARMGIVREEQLFGGVAPHRFIATKIVSHGLLVADARAPSGWSGDAAAALGDSVLHGFSVFSEADARAAGRLLLAHGPIRLKDVEATAGRGQVVVQSAEALDAAIEAIDPVVLARSGLVIEENLTDVITYSVGTVRLFGQAIAYWGTQRLTIDNHGEEVYGGSQLHCVRGGFDALLDGQGIAPEIAEAVRKAAHFDTMLFAAYPGLFASRRNYDVVMGRDAQGRQRIGVLEQSWRAGGASGAEILAFEALAANPDLAEVTCATMEIYGEADAAPPDAALYYGGVDPVAGPLTKYAVRL